MRLFNGIARAFIPVLLVISLFFSASLSLAAEPDKSFALLSLEGLVELISKEAAGKVAVITVFASWCPPCQEEIPMLVRMRGEYAQEQLQIFGISADESIRALKKFVKNKQVNFPVYSGTQQLFMLMGVEAIPHMFIFNKKGELVQDVVGLIPEADLKAILSRLMSEENV